MYTFHRNAKKKMMAVKKQRKKYMVNATSIR